MSDQKKDLSGPYFPHGVPIASLEEGKPLLGHANGEAIVLVRSGDSFSAIGATCTHYNGPLAEGLVVGSTIRCPWHHACFDLKTGEAIGGPALNDLPCYEVVRSGDTVRVGARKSVMICGSGPAGNAAAEMLRKLGYKGAVVLIGDERPVDRPNLSKDFLAGNAPEEWLPLRDTGFYAAKNIEFIGDDPVESIDTKSKSVTLKSGNRVGYQSLLLATGAAPTRLQLPGADLPNVHTLRTLADSKAIIARAQKGSRAVIIGASFIGLEVAASLRAREVNVELVAQEEIPLARILGPEAGAFVRKLHEEHGVKFHLQSKPKELQPNAVLLESGQRLECDFVVMGVGVKPRVQLAEAAGLKVDNGIVVDGSLRTSDPSIYAAGDVARYPDPALGELSRVEHFVAAERQGQHAARAILGDKTPFHDPPFFWSAHYDVTFSYVGRALNWDRIDLEGSLEKRDAALYFRKGSRTLATVTVGRDQASLRFEAQLEKS